MNKDPESWSRVSVDAVCAGSPAQVRNILAMALDDIRTLSVQMNYWRELVIAHGRRLTQQAPRPSYTISSGKTITCHKCGLTSANLSDVAHRYCGHCQLFHEEV